MKKTIVTFLTLITVVLAAFYFSACGSSTNLKGTYETVYCSKDTETTKHSITVTLKNDNVMEMVYKEYTLSSADATPLTTATYTYSGKWFELANIDGISQIYAFIEIPRSSGKGTEKEILDNVTVCKGTASFRFDGYFILQK